MSNTLPTHILYQVIERENEKPIWNRVGVAWSHKKGEGFNMHLNSIPLSGRLVMRKSDPEKGETGE